MTTKASRKETSLIPENERLGLPVGSLPIHARDGDVVVWHDRHGNVRGVVKVTSGGVVEFVPAE